MRTKQPPMYNRSMREREPPECALRPKMQVVKVAFSHVRYEYNDLLDTTTLK